MTVGFHPLMTGVMASENTASRDDTAAANVRQTSSPTVVLRSIGSGRVESSALYTTTSTGRSISYVIVRYVISSSGGQIQQTSSYIVSRIAPSPMTTVHTISSARISNSSLKFTTTLMPQGKPTTNLNGLTVRRCISESDQASIGGAGRVVPFSGDRNKPLLLLMVFLYILLFAVGHFLMLPDLIEAAEVPRDSPVDCPTTPQQESPGDEEQELGTG